jgi:hypothetical protein
MGLQQQALHFEPPGLLLRLNLVKWELKSARRRQPSLQRSEFEGGWSGYASGQRSLALEGREWGWVARRDRRQKSRCDRCC